MSKVNLYPHQKKALQETANKNKVAYYLDMGLGKTFVGSEKATEMDTKHTLIVCQKSKIDDWVEHFREYYDVNVYDLTKDLNTFKLQGGVGIINYDIVWRREFNFLKDFTLMLDESSLIQNSKSKRTKFILKMKPKNVILLSGTPVGGRYENLWSQLKLLGCGLTQQQFNSTFVNYRKQKLFSGQYIPVVTGYKNVDFLKKTLRKYGAVFMKTKEVINLPEQVDNIVKVKKTRAYNRFHKNKIITVENTELIGDTSLTEMLYKRQLASQYNKNKFKSLEDIIDSTSDRLIIFYNFVNEVDKIKALLKKKKITHISEVNGQVKDLNAYEKYEDSITLIQYQSGAKGLNLQKANKVIYFSLPLSSEDFEQSKKRTHRIGQKKTCFYYYLITNNTIDEKIYRTLLQRRDYTNELFKKETEI